MIQCGFGRFGECINSKICLRFIYFRAKVVVTAIWVILKYHILITKET